MKKYDNKHILVIGAARQGLAISRYLDKHGAKVTLTDARPENDLLDAKNSLADTQVQTHFGEHPFSLLDGTDLICVSGGVPLDIPIIKEAKQRHIQLSNDSQIFLENCPCTVIGITGSAGKTTTTALLGQMADRFFEMKSNKNRAWTGGNIGNPLISNVDEMQEDDLAIMELSSFQLELMTRSPHIAAVLNITPNHLDRHGTLGAYTAAKVRILKFQKQADLAILNREDKGSWNLREELHGDLISFGYKKPDKNDHGTYIEKGNIMLQIAREQMKMLPIDWIPLRGEHNLLNVLAACAIAAGATIALPAIQTAIEEFEGIPHRMQLVASRDGVQWYDDSIATTPERSLAAIKSFDEPIVLLLGGRDKNLPWEELLQTANQKVKQFVLFGEAANMIAEKLEKIQKHTSAKPHSKVETLQDAIKEAAKTAEDGDVVLLSPGGTSYDAFVDFEERGNCYAKWISEL
jgi:UDP-N-acetylmuramoylalanine--D-glutamate ligase